MCAVVHGAETSRSPGLLLWEAGGMAPDLGWDFKPGGLAELYVVRRVIVNVLRA